LKETEALISDWVSMKVPFFPRLEAAAGIVAFSLKVPNILHLDEAEEFS
jgi:hypothetical protein